MPNNNPELEQKFKELIEDEDNLNWFVDNYAPRLKQILQQRSVSGALPQNKKLICGTCGDWYGIDNLNRCYRCVGRNFTEVER